MKKGFSSPLNALLAVLRMAIKTKKSAKKATWTCHCGNDKGAAMDWEETVTGDYVYKKSDDKVAESAEGSAKKEKGGKWGF